MAKNTPKSKYNRCSKCGKVEHDRIVIDIIPHLDTISNKMVMKLIEIEIKIAAKKIVNKYSNSGVKLYSFIIKEN